MAYRNSVSTTAPTVVDEIAALSTLSAFGLSIHPERCVRLRNRNSRCNRCAQACTSGAISFCDGEWKMSPELCVGCGTCATVCPTCALEARHPSDTELLRKASKNVFEDGDGKRTACFACEKAFAESALPLDAEKVAQVICLSRLEETLLFSLYEHGVERVVGICGTCNDCPRARGLESVKLVQDTVERLAKGWDLHVEYVVRQEPPCAVTASEAQLADGVSRKTSDAQVTSALSDGEQLRVGERGSISASFKPTHVQKDGTLPHFVPSRRRKLLDSLASFGEPVEERLDTRLWGHVIINFDKCKSCKMCAVFCPTGAICKYSDEAGVVGIEHYLAECVHCKLCQDTCPAHAIVCTTDIPLHQLASGETERYRMPDPEWVRGSDQILQRMRAKISGNSVEHSY